MPQLPTSAAHRSDDRAADGQHALGALQLAPAIPTIRRAYFELVASRQHSGPDPLTLLADPRFEPALRALRAAAGDDTFRVAALTTLWDDEAQAREELDAVASAADALARHGLGLDVWPQLPDSARFLCGTTARTFQERLLPLVDGLEKRGHIDVGLALDLEPPASWSTSVWSVGAGPLPSRARGAAQLLWGTTRNLLGARQGRRDLVELARDLTARPIPLHVAVLPPMSADGELLRGALMSVPSVDDDGIALFETQAAMCYATSLSRLTRRYDRQRQKQTLALWGARHKQRSDAVIVGQTSVGVFGDEPTYDSALHLAEDVRAMEALGFTDIGVFALEGLLFGPSGMPDHKLTLRGDVDAWLLAAMGR